jgi:hypothetical protein
MSGRPPLLRQDERPALLRRPHRCRIDMLARLLAVPPVWAAAATLACERHPVDEAWLRARRHGEASSWHGPDLGPLLVPERETSTHATGYTQLDHRSPPVVRAPGCWSTAGAFRLCAPLPGGARHGGEKAPARRERKGSEWRKVFAKQNPEGGRKPLKAGGRAFGASLARRTAGATLVPLSRACQVRFSKDTKESERTVLQPWGTAYVATGGSRSLLLAFTDR